MQISEILDQVYDAESRGQSRESSQILLRYIIDNTKNDNTTAIDELLFKVNLDFLGKHALCGIVRFTAAYRHCLVHWSETYRCVCMILKGRGLNTDRLLVGIKND